MRAAGVRIATPQSTLDAAQVLLPGIFVVVVTWISARFVLSGTIDAGDLVAFYGYAAFLVIPLRTAAEAVDKVTRSLVGARRMLGVLEVERVVSEPDAPAPEPPAGALLVDLRSGVEVPSGLTTCIVSAAPEESAAIAARLGRLSADRGVRLGDRPLEELSLAAVRRRIVVSEQEPILFSGELRAQLDPWRRAPSDQAILDAVGVANAFDVLDALPDGLDATIDERGRSFSGGQRQRLVLARALLADPEILVLVEPTSAVDAHTEARIARDLRRARVGRTTVIVTTSPLVLDQADRVVLVVDGRQVGRGHASRAPPRAGRLSRRRHARGERVSLLPIADGAAARARAGARAPPPRRARGRRRAPCLRRGHRPRRAGAARPARRGGRGRDDGVVRRHRRGRPRRRSSSSRPASPGSPGAPRSSSRS